MPSLKRSLSPACAGLFALALGCGQQPAAAPAMTSEVAAQVAPPPAAPAAAATKPGVQPVPAADRPAIKSMLYDAAVRQGVNPGLVMGVAWWESGWDQAAVSDTGAIGIMQVNPDTAATAGPNLLHRQANPHVLADNIELGTAILREDLDRYGNDLVKALVCYYDGPPAIKAWAQLDPDARAYVTGVYKLALAFDAGKGPA